MEYLQPLFENSFNVENKGYKIALQEEGFSIVADVYSEKEIQKILALIDSVDSSGSAFRKQKDLFAIRRFFHEIPEAADIIFNDNLKRLIHTIGTNDFFVVKSIYFDKPPGSNWYVPYHQDLTIAVDKKKDLDSYVHWSVKDNYFSVQPPIDILENIFTIRIHLDDTDESNGALKVIPRSHAKKIYRPDTINWAKEKERTCPVKKGSVMIMKPLLLHSSLRTTNNNRRRVIHIEFSDQQLAPGLNWVEKYLLTC